MHNIAYKLVIILNLSVGLAFASPCDDQQGSVTIYDENGFGGDEIHYKRWCWNNEIKPGGLNGNILPMLHWVSIDGVNWIEPSPPDNGKTYQAPNSMSVIQLATGISGDNFQYFYGPSRIIYNAAPTFIPEDPFTFPYVMYFDTASEGAALQTGLACSNNGVFWVRFGDAPVLNPVEPIILPSESIDILLEPLEIIPQPAEIIPQPVDLITEPVKEMEIQEVVEVENPIVIVAPGPALPLPPASIKVRQIKNRFLFKTETVDEITWQPSPTSSVRAYKIYCDDELVATVAARVLQFQDRKHGGMGFNYTVTALDDNGESEPKGL